MATAKQIKDEADSVILARLQGKAIDQYSLSDGRSIRRASLSEILNVRREYAAEAAAESEGSSIAILRWTDDAGIPA